MRWSAGRFLFTAGLVLVLFCSTSNQQTYSHRLTAHECINHYCTCTLYSVQYWYSLETRFSLSLPLLQVLPGVTYCSLSNPNCNALQRQRTLYSVHCTYIRRTVQCTVLRRYVEGLFSLISPCDLNKSCSVIQYNLRFWVKAVQCCTAVLYCTLYCTLYTAV